MDETVSDARKSSLTGHGQVFLLVNLLGFPATGFVVLPALSRLSAALSAPLWVFLALPVAVGVVLMAFNVWMTSSTWRVHGWGAEAAAMSAWTGLCLLTFVLLGTFSPINLALRLFMGGMAPTGF